MQQSQTYVFFGQIGSGKGTQAKLLMDYLKNQDKKDSVYAGTGEEFRKLLVQVNPTTEAIKKTLNRGELQPDFLTTSLFTNVLINFLTSEKHLFVDGYPRTLVQ